MRGKKNIMLLSVGNPLYGCRRISLSLPCQKWIVPFLYHLEEERTDVAFVPPYPKFLNLAADFDFLFRPLSLSS